MIPVSRRGDEGSSLVFALGFMAVFGLLIGLLLADAEGSMRMTRLAAAKDDGIYAADAGIEHGIQRLRIDNTLCAFDGDDPNVGTFTVNGRETRVSCQVDFGGALGAGGWAIITKEISTDSLTTQAGDSSNIVKKIGGPVFAGGLENNIKMEVKDGDVFEKYSVGDDDDDEGGTCTSNADKPLELFIIPAGLYRYRCTQSGFPSVPHELPSAVPPLAPPFEDLGSNCRRFYPGKYVGAPPPAAPTPLPIDGKNYFVTGVYYFENIFLDLKNSDSVAGKRRDADPTAGDDGEEQINTYSPCASDPAGWNNGTGAKWILGGSSRLNVDNPSGRIEIYARFPPAGVTTEGTEAISLMTVPISPAPPAGWLSTTATYDPAENRPPALASVGEGNSPALTIHGMAYVPDGYVDFKATNNSKAQLRGGIVAGRLHLKAAASVTGFVISVKTGPLFRRIVLTSRVPGTPGVVARALVEIKNDAARTPTIRSWRTGLE